MDVATASMLIVILLSTILLLFALMISYYLLLKHISITSPDYYRKIGSPFLPRANRTVLKTINHDAANYRLLFELLAAPKRTFPDDVRSRNLARYVRFELLGLILLLGISVSFGLALYY